MKRLLNLPRPTQAIIGIVAIPLLVAALPFLTLWVMGTLVFDLCFEDHSYRGVGTRLPKPPTGPALNDYAARTPQGLPITRVEVQMPPLKVPLRNLSRARPSSQPTHTQ